MSSGTIQLDYEEVLEHIGSLGRYQIILFNLVASFTWKHATNLVVTVFHVVRPRFVCRPQASAEEADAWEEAATSAAAFANSTALAAEADQCWSDVSGDNSSSATACTAFVYDRSEWRETIATQWDLVCGRSGLEPLVFATYALGFGFGLVLGVLADRFGRRPVVLASCALEALLTAAESLSPNLATYLALHFVHGIFATVSLLAAVCITELVASRHRALVANLLWLYWCVGYVSVAGLAYLVRHWRWLQLCTCLPCLCYAACYFFLQESPRWLIARGRNAEALRVCQSIARINGRSIPAATAELMTAQRPVDNPEGHVKEMFNTTVMLRKTLVLFCAWFTISLTYYGISLDSGFVVGDIFVNTALSGLVEAPAYVAAWLLAEKVGRRVSLVAMYIVLGGCLVGCSLLPEGKCMLAGAWCG